jgi:hypothetical protein
MTGVSVTNVAVAVGGSGVEVNASVGVGGTDVKVRTSVGGIGVNVGAGSSLFILSRNGIEAATMVAAAPMMAMITFWFKNGSELRLLLLFPEVFFSFMAATFVVLLILSRSGSI